MVAAVVIGVTLAIGPFAAATHSWGGYHWARTTPSFTLALGDNVTSSWDSYLQTTSTDWSTSTVLDTTIVAGGTNPKTCRAVPGRVEVCSAAYGNNGWLGLASIWITSGGHITQGTVKLNDTYYKKPAYNTPAWRNLVMCQEVGHTFGLGHQDEDFDNTALGSCMDYSNDPAPNQHPNGHDYELLEGIYAHTDSTTTVGATSVSAGQGPTDWGKVRSSGDHHSVYENDLGNGNRVVTFVIWAR